MRWLSIKLHRRNKKTAKNRLKEHADESHNSAVSKHVYQCEGYLQKLHAKFDAPTAKEKLEFLKSNFSIIETNLSNYNNRKTAEGIEIKLQKTELNKQVKSRIIEIF